MCKVFQEVSKRVRRNREEGNGNVPCRRQESFSSDLVYVSHGNAFNKNWLALSFQQKGEISTGTINSSQALDLQPEALKCKESSGDSSVTHEFNIQPFMISGDVSGHY